MTDSQPSPSDWPTCQVDDDCIGVQLDAADRGCLRHTDDEAASTHWWARVREGEPLDARGLTFTSEQLQQVLEYAPRHLPESDGQPGLVEANFERATFRGDADFIGVVFIRNAHFRDAHFCGVTDFGIFAAARFGQKAFFQRAHFDTIVSFMGVNFVGSVNFESARFAGDALFSGTHFGDEAFFLEAHFRGPAVFRKTCFAGRAVFKGANFSGEAVFDTPDFTGDGRLRSDDVVFEQMVTITGSMTHFSARKTRFGARARIELSDADVDFAGATFHNSSLLIARQPEGDEYRPYQPCRLVSLEEADVANLTVAGVDLSSCRFAGAHHLDQLRLEGPQLFAESPRQWKGVRWSRRQIIAEEHAWRRTTYNAGNDDARKARGWYPSKCQSAEDGDPPHRTAVQIAGIYRDLRKGREDAKDAPGAADFYYGETEMRRKSASSSSAERTILFLYWLLSGYALRASRAFIALAVVGVVSVVLLTTGLIDDLTVSEAFWVSLESVVLRAPTDTDDLTDQARNLTTVLRIAGPVLLALAVLSIRGRVKR